MTVPDADFSALLDEQRLRIETEAEPTLVAELRKEAAVQLATRIAIALLFLQKNPSEKSCNVAYATQHFRAPIGYAIDVLVARGHFVTHWINILDPVGCTEQHFWLEIFRVGYHPPGMCLRPLPLFSMRYIWAEICWLAAAAKQWSTGRVKRD